MLISEFIDRTGFRPTEDYYHIEIEPEYYRSNLDKDAWCKQWKKNGGIQKAYDYMVDKSFQTIHLENENESLANEISSLKAGLKDLSESYNALLDERKESIEDKIKMMYELLEISEKYSSAELREIVINAIGFKEYIRYKFEHDKCIWQLDRDEIVSRM